MLGYDFFRLGRPEANPTATLFWTPVYEDLAGQGLMTTGSKPIVHEGRFLGVLSVDVVLQGLLRANTRTPVPYSDTVLFDGAGNHMTGTGALPSATEWQQLTTRGRLHVDGAHLLATSIPATGRWLVTTTPARRMGW